MTQNSDLTQQGHVSESEKPVFSLIRIKGKIIDLDTAASIMGKNDDVMAKKLLNLFIELLPQEISVLQKSYRINDWEMISMMTHKLRGSSSYCGTLRIKTACTNLENYITAGLIKNRYVLYYRVLSEIKMVQSAYKKIKY